MIFSVVIPCYNCVKTLEATVNSVRACGLTDYEILLIDDGSSDGTAKLCDTLCVRYPELRCVHQENAGVSAARNRGIDEAQGEYLWFVDADDTVDAGALSHAADITAKQRPDVLLFGISFDYYYHGKLYRRDKLVPPCAGNLTLEQLKKQFQEFYECNALTTACNKFMRRDILMQSGVRFREDMILMEDFLFVLELLPYCQNIYSLPEAIYRYRQAEDEKSAYYRLQKIVNLAEYIQPIAEGIQQLQIPDAEAIAEKIYMNALFQSMAYAPVKQIQKRLMVHQLGRYANAFTEKQSWKIWIRYRTIYLRHRLAVLLKSSWVLKSEIVR